MLGEFVMISELFQIHIKDGTLERKQNDSNGYLQEKGVKKKLLHG